LLVFLALGLLGPTFPVQALAQSNGITLSLGRIAAQSRTLRSPAAGSTQISPDVTLVLTTVTAFCTQNSLHFTPKSNLSCPIAVDRVHDQSCGLSGLRPNHGQPESVEKRWKSRNKR